MTEATTPDDGPVTAQRPGRWDARALGARLLGWWPYAVAAAASLLVALWEYRPWRFGSAIPFPSGDALAFAAWVQNVVETGWYENGPRLAAPFGQNSHGYTLTDEALLAWMGKVMAPLTGSTGAAISWWVTLSIPLTAVAVVALARYLGASRLVSILPAVAFAILPDTLNRGTGHYGLANTWTLAIGMLAVLSLVHPPRHTGRRRVVWEAALLVGLAVVTLTSAYYGVFTGILAVAAGLGGALARRSWRPLGLVALRGAALGTPLVVAVGLDRLYLPDPLGYQAFAVTRTLTDAESYGGRLIQLLLPPTGHRVGLLADIRAQYDHALGPYAEGPALGAVAAMAFLGLMIWAVLAYWRPDWLRHNPVTASLAGLTWVGLVGYLAGGLGIVWAIALGGGGIRVWSRMHVVIALLVLLALGLALDKLALWWRVGVVTLLVAVAMVDQTRPAVRPDPGVAHAFQDEVGALTAQIAERSGSDASVFQYPVVVFPVQQRSLGTASPYDGFLPFLYSNGLHWSYGALQGDPTADWQLELVERPLEEQLALLSAAGFSGVLVDTAVLSDAPDELATWQEVGPPDLTSSSGRWRFYDLAPDGCSAEAAETAGDVAVRPPLLYGGPGADPRPGGVWVDAAGDASLRLVTLRAGGWDEVRVGFSVDTPVPLRITWPDGTAIDVEQGSHDLHWSGPAESPELPITLHRLGEAPGPVQVRGFDPDVEVPVAAAACVS